MEWEYGDRSHFPTSPPARERRDSLILLPWLFRAGGKRRFGECCASQAGNDLGVLFAWFERRIKREVVGICFAPDGIGEVFAVLGSLGIDALDHGCGFHMVDVLALHNATDAGYERCVDEYVEGAGAFLQDGVCAAANDNAAPLICELCDCVGLGQP